jgi:hypothetical protein
MARRAFGDRCRLDHDIVVPGRTLLGSVRKASSVCSFHVMPDAVIALEYVAPATVR